MRAGARAGADLLAESLPAVEVAPLTDTNRRLGLEHRRRRADRVDDLVGQCRLEQLVVPAFGVAPEPLPLRERILRRVSRAVEQIRVVVRHLHRLLVVVLPLVGLQGIVPRYHKAGSVPAARLDFAVYRNRSVVAVAGIFVCTVVEPLVLGEVAPVGLEVVEPRAAVPVLLIRDVGAVGRECQLAPFGSIGLRVCLAEQDSFNLAVLEVFVDRAAEWIFKCRGN